MVPYESRKREKIHISYIVHPRKISLTQSRGSSSFFILKSGVRFSIWPFLNFCYRVIENSKEFCGKGRRCKILIFSFFQPLWGLVSCPHSLYTVHSIQSQFYFHPTVVSEFPLVPKWPAVKVERLKKTSVLVLKRMFFRSSKLDDWPFWNQWEIRDIMYLILKV